MIMRHEYALPHATRVVPRCRRRVSNIAEAIHFASNATTSTYALGTPTPSPPLRNDAIMRAGRDSVCGISAGVIIQRWPTCITVVLRVCDDAANTTFRCVAARGRAGRPRAPIRHVTMDGTQMRVAHLCVNQGGATISTMGRRHDNDALTPPHPSRTFFVTQVP